MKFFLDENFPKLAHGFLADRGFEAFDIRGTSDEGLHDDDIFKLALAKEAVFLTTDGDFFHTVPHHYPNHYGVVVITLRQPNRDSILQKLDWFLEHFSDLNLNNRVFRLKDHAFVTYPPLDE